MKQLFLLAFLLVSSSTAAVVKRHDIPAELYELKTMPDFLVDMPYEGSAVLIDKQWILSAAHVVYHDGYVGMPISIHGVENRIEKVVFHPNYRKQRKEPYVGDAKPLMEFLYGRSDVVLIKLAKLVEHVQPIKRYSGSEEKGKLTTTYGKGATGTGLTGELFETKKARPLNYFNNQIDVVKKEHLLFRFDEPEKGLPLEGTVGSGDSGGPTTIEEKGTQYLIGVQCFRDYQGDLKDFVGGNYGSVAVLCRVSAHNDWIDKTIASHKPD